MFGDFSMVMLYCVLSGYGFCNTYIPLPTHPQSTLGLIIFLRFAIYVIHLNRCCLQHISDAVISDVVIPPVFWEKISRFPCRLSINGLCIVGSPVMTRHLKQLLDSFLDISFSPNRVSVLVSRNAREHSYWLRVSGHFDDKNRILSIP